MGYDWKRHQARPKAEPEPEAAPMAENAFVCPQCGAVMTVESVNKAPDEAGPTPEAEE